MVARARIPASQWCMHDLREDHTLVLTTQAGRSLRVPQCICKPKHELLMSISMPAVLVLPQAPRAQTFAARFASAEACRQRPAGCRGRLCPARAARAVAAA